MLHKAPPHRTDRRCRARGALLVAGLFVAALPALADDKRAGPHAPKPGTAKTTADRAAKSGTAKTTADRAAKTKKHHRGRHPQAGAEPSHHLASLSPLTRSIHCPADMVAVAGRVCVDRYEGTLFSVEATAPLSPFYPPSAKLALSLFESWSHAREDDYDEGSPGHDMPLPFLPPHHQTPFHAAAHALAASTPSGYMSGEMAGAACHAAGKRLCKEDEWVTACRGEKQTFYPYGDKYAQDACNVFREEHPGHLLHGEFSTGLLDPRLNQVEFDGKPLLRTTGATASCVSRWGDDALYDMVGNLDEWVDDPEGTFVGGFYARATRNGCDARVGAHPINYFDYSTGVRCCKDPEPGD